MVAIPKMILHSLKVKLGVLPDLDAALEVTANTSLDFHAGTRVAADVSGVPAAPPVGVGVVLVGLLLQCILRYFTSVGPHRRHICCPFSGFFNR